MVNNKLLFELYDEYQEILSLLTNKTYQLEEKVNFIDITLYKDINLDLLNKISNTIQNFDLNCNPFSEEYEDIIEDIERGYKNISEITSISINFDKDEIDSIKNIHYIFFDRESALKNTRFIGINEGLEKINIGIINNVEIETELYQFIDLRVESIYDNIVIKEIDVAIAKNIEFYLSNNRNNDHNYYFNPYSFTIKGISDSESEFTKLIKAEFYKVMLQSISDKVENNTFIIRGEKNVAVILDDGFSTNNYEHFLDIFRFLISHQKFTEKFIITKKVVTLYIHNNEKVTDLDEKLPEIWKTINHYYNHYIEDNIKEFFKTKDQLLKEAMNASKVIYEQTDKISTSINASIISTLILLVTTLYRSLDSLNIVFTSIFILVFLLFSCGFYYLMWDSTIKRYKLTSDQFDHFINEISLIQKEEVGVIRDRYLEKPYEVLKNTLNKLLILLTIINLVMIVSYLVYICVKYNYCLC